MSERDALRYTPAGIPILNFSIHHASEQIEAGQTRQVEFEITCVATEEQARLIAGAPLGIRLNVRGFLAAKGRSSKQLALHIDTIEFEEN